MHSTLWLATALAALLLPSANAFNQPHEEQYDLVVHKGYLNTSYYKNFPPNAVNFRPRMQKSLGYEEPEEVIDEDLQPSKTVPERLHPRSTFSYNCPTSIECPDSGCCPVGSWCTVIEGHIGCCDLPM